MINEYLSTLSLKKTRVLKLLNLHYIFNYNQNFQEQFAHFHSDLLLFFTKYKNIYIPKNIL